MNQLMDYTRRVLPVPGEVWKHFKGHYYIIIAIAEDTSTGTMKVVYQPTPEYNDKSVWVRSLDEFMSDIDLKKYPIETYPEYHTQNYRFERVPNYEKLHI